MKKFLNYIVNDGRTYFEINLNEDLTSFNDDVIKIINITSVPNNIKENMISIMNKIGNPDSIHNMYLEMALVLRVFREYAFHQKDINMISEDLLLETVVNYLGTSSDPTQEELNEKISQLPIKFMYNPIIIKKEA